MGPLMPDLSVQLDAWLAARRRTRFVWGRADCALFAADWVLAATGEDFASWFRGRYDSPASAWRALRRFAGGSLVKTATAQLGAPLATPNLARRGDIVLLDPPPGFAIEVLGICAGHVIAYQAAPSGVGYLPLRNAINAWRLPEPPAS